MPLSACCFMVCVLTAEVLGAPPTFDLPAFQSLAPEHQRTIVGAAIESREAHFRNFAYDLTESTSNVNLASGVQRPLGRDEYGLRRKGGKMLLRERQSQDGRPVGDLTTSWDGTRSLTLTTRPERPEPRGLVEDSESPNFTLRAYHAVLGTRMHLDREKVSLAEWLKDAFAEPAKARIETVSEGGVNLIAITVPDGLRYWKYWLDPSKGFMPVQAEYLYRFKDDYNRELITVTESREVDGVWAPTRVVRRTGTSADAHNETEIVYEVSDFKFGMVTDEDVSLEFPPGTEVVDMIAKVGYRILPGGKREFVPVGDPVSGTVFEAPGGLDPVEAIDAALAEVPAPPVEANAPKLLGYVRPPAPAAGVPRWVGPGVMIAGVVMIAVGLTVYSRRRVAGG